MGWKIVVMKKSPRFLLPGGPSAINHRQCGLMKINDFKDALCSDSCDMVEY
jgi:hypothetical protein